MYLLSINVPGYCQHLHVYQSIHFCEIQWDVGTSILTEVKGKRTLKLLTYGETYVMNSPNLLIRILPVPGIDWVGDVRVQCQETGLGAELHYRRNSFIGLGRNYRSIKGKIVDLSSSQTLYEIEGHWDRYSFPPLKCK